MIKSVVYSGLVYPKDNEIDGIIVVEDTVFLIEVKGKKKRVIAGVGDVLGLTKQDFKAHIVDAYTQTQRAFKYIQSKDAVEFKNKNGALAPKLRKSNIKKFYQVVVCLENFSKLSIDINLVKAWIPELLKANEYPWIVNIFDLIVISDFLERESFITYIDERIKVAENSAIEAIDETDYLGYFLENGNLGRLKNLEPSNSTLIVGFSEGIDRWYSFLRGEVSKSEKPVLKKSL